MRLTKTIRSAFVRADMDDVPELDYRTMIQKMSTDAAIAMMPPEVLRAYKKHPDWFSSVNQRVGNFGYLYLPIPSHQHLPAAVIDQIDKLNSAANEQKAARSNLRIKLAGLADGCTTKKALVAALPEFEKYLPADEVAACRTLPVVANVVADFVKAGWPKSEKPKLKVAK